LGSNNEQQRARSRDDDIEISTPLGWGIRANGRVVTMLVLVIAAVVLLAWMIRAHDLRQTEQLKQVSDARNGQMIMLASRQDRLQDSMDTVIYILSIPPEERSKFKLDMPPALRARLLTQERNR